jgi:hypothetical protein
LLIDILSIPAADPPEAVPIYDLRIVLQQKIANHRQTFIIGCSFSDQMLKVFISFDEVDLPFTFT